MDKLIRRLEVKHEGGTIPDRWINNDIKPIESGRRTWGFWTFHNYCQFALHSGWQKFSAV